MFGGEGGREGVTFNRLYVCVGGGGEGELHLIEWW